jgi:hypothetical protein
MSNPSETTVQNPQTNAAENTATETKLTPLQRLKARQASAQQNLKAARKGGSAPGAADAPGAMHQNDHAQRPMHSNKMGDS